MEQCGSESSPIFRTNPLSPSSRDLRWKQSASTLRHHSKIWSIKWIFITTHGRSFSKNWHFMTQSIFPWVCDTRKRFDIKICPESEEYSPFTHPISLIITWMLHPNYIYVSQVLRFLQLPRTNFMYASHLIFPARATYPHPNYTFNFTILFIWGFHQPLWSLYRHVGEFECI